MLALASLFVGLFLLGLNSVGWFKKPVEAKVSQHDGGVYNYHVRSLEPSVAMREFSALKSSSQDGMEKASDLHRILSSSLIHANYRMRASDNWVMWVVGQLYPPFLESQNADLIWRRGVAKCGQASMVYVAKARQLDLDAQILGLDGHVVVEVSHASGTQVMDADMGVCWNLSYKELRSLAKDEVIHTYLAKGFSRPQAELVADIIANTKQPRRYSYPNARRLYIFEVLSQWLCWFVPLLLICMWMLSL